MDLVPPPARLAVRLHRAIAVALRSDAGIRRRVGQLVKRIRLRSKDRGRALQCVQLDLEGLLDGAGVLGRQGVLGRERAVNPTEQLSFSHNDHCFVF